MARLIRRLATAALTSFALATASVFVDACETATPQQIADALSRAPGLNSGLRSCAMAAMTMNESGGGNTCAQNNCCIGIIQINGSSNGLNWTQAQRQAYMTADLQTQINGWIAVANFNASSSGYQTHLAAYSSGRSIGGQKSPPVS